MIGLTGASGVLGSAVRREMAVSAFDGDIRDADVVARWIAAGAFDAVIHFAAVVPVKVVETNARRAFEVNAGGTLNLCEAIRASGKKTWLFVASTSHVYAPSEAPLDEDDRSDPISLYGLSKLQSEQIAIAWGRRFGFDVCVGRIFSFSAKTQSDDYFLPSLARRIREAADGETLRISGGLQTRDFLSTPQIATIIRALTEKRATGIFNIASGRGVRLIDVAAELAHACERSDLHFVADGDNASSLVADVRKLATLGITPRPDLHDLLREIATR